MNCLIFTLKLYTYVFNTIFAILGLITIGYGVYIITMIRYSQEELFTAIFIIGAIMIAVSILGCFALNRKSACMLWLFFVIIAIFLTLSIVSLVRSYAPSAYDIVEYSWQKREENPSIISTYERKFSCCGLNGYNDYLMNNETIPVTCYVPGYSHQEFYLHDYGCGKKIQKLIDPHAKYIQIGNWILVGIEGTAAVFSAILAIYYHVNRKNNYSHKL